MKRKTDIKIARQKRERKEEEEGRKMDGLTGKKSKTETRKGRLID